MADETQPERAPSSELGRRFLVGGLALTLATWVTYAFNFGIQIALARLLGPEAIGFYAFVFAVNEFINIVGAPSLKVALIQAKEESERLYDTALAMSGGLAAIGLLLAVGVGAILEASGRTHAAVFLLAFAGARILLFLAQVPEAKLERSIRYSRLGLLAIVSGLVPNLLAVVLALSGLGVWSLLWRDLGVAALVVTLATLWSGYRFRGAVDRPTASRLVRFAAPLSASRTVEIALERVDRFLVGLLRGDTAVGFYHQSRFLAESGQVATRGVMQLVLNLYARLQDQPERLARAYQVVEFFLARLMLCGASALLLFPEEVVRLLLGKEWLEVAPLLWCLAGYAAIAPLLEHSKLLLYALGRVGQVVRIRLIQIAVFVPGVLLFSLRGSLLGVAAVLALTTLLALLLVWSAAGRPLRPSLASFGRALLALGLAAALIGLLDAMGGLAWVPWMLRPLLAPAAFAACLAALEGAEVWRKLVYLRGFFPAARPGPPAPVPSGPV